MHLVSNQTVDFLLTPRGRILRHLSGVAVIVGCSVINSLFRPDSLAIHLILGFVAVLGVFPLVGAVLDFSLVSWLSGRGFWGNDVRHELTEKPPKDFDHYQLKPNNFSYLTDHLHAA